MKTSHLEDVRPVSEMRAGPSGLPIRRWFQTWTAYVKGVCGERLGSGLAVSGIEVAWRSRRQR